MGASNEDATSQLEQSSVSKLDVVLPVKRKAENDHAVRNGRGQGFAPGLLHCNPINVAAAFGGLLQQQQEEEEEEEEAEEEQAVSRLQQLPFGAPVPALGQDGPRLALNVALAYDDQVKGQFADQPEVYKRFIDTLKDWKSQAIDTAGVIERVSDLFSGNPSLIQNFRFFLPPSWENNKD
jgi:paired amphipathic helix protein Sin3a